MESSYFSPHMNISMETVYKYSRSLLGISDRQLSEIRDFLQSANRDLSCYDDEISRLENRLFLLRYRRERAKQYTMALRSLLSPIHRLPNELLLQIFRDVCEDVETSRISRFGLSTAPFYLSAVCTRWRSLCISHSRLWSDFEVNCECAPQITAAVDLYLERSKHQPLTLRVIYFEASRHGDKLLQRLIDCSARWQNIKLPSPLLSDLHGLSFPSLEVLRTDDDLEEGEVDLGLFVQAPQLRTLAVSEEFIPNHTVLGRITDLTYSFDTGNLYDILNLCSTLRTLSILNRKASDEEPVTPSAGPTIVPTLTSLHVLSADYLWRPLRALITPALTTLSLEHTAPKSLSGAKQIKTRLHVEGFLDLSGCSLTKLVLQLSWFDQDVVALLRRLPALEDLTVSELCSGPRPVTKAFVESLHGFQQSALQQSSLPIVPKLRSLTLKMSTAAKFDHKSFVETISSRWIPDEDYAAAIGLSCIRVVDLSLLAAEEKDYLPLVQLRRMGLCFDLRTTH